MHSKTSRISVLLSLSCSLRRGALVSADNGSRQPRRPTFDLCDLVLAGGIGR